MTKYSLAAWEELQRLITRNDDKLSDKDLELIKIFTQDLLNGENTFQAQLKELADENRYLKDSLERKDERYNNLKAENIALSNSLEDKKKDDEDKNYNLFILKENNQKLQEEKEGFFRRYELLEESLDDKNSDIRSLKIKIEDLKDENASLEDKLSDKNQELRILKAKIEEDEENLIERRKILQRFADENEKQEEEIKALKNKILECEDEKSNIRFLLEDQKNAKEAYKAKLEEAEDNLRKIKNLTMVDSF